MLITIGILFLLDSVSGIGFGRTWPAILLVVGVVKLMQSNASSAGHVGPLPPGTGFPPSPPTPGVSSPEPTPPSQAPGPQTSSSGEVKNV